MPRNQFHHNYNQNGNVLFLILIAVALFATLSYAVTNSTRNSGEDVSREKREMVITQILQHAVSIRTAVQRLTLSGRCDDYSIRYWHVSRTNASADNQYGDGSNTQCQVFHPDGGGVSYLERPKELQEPVGSDEIMILADRIEGIGTSGAGTGAEHIMVVNVPRQVCIEINNKLNIVNTDGEPPAYITPITNQYISPGNSSYTFPSAFLDGYHTLMNYPGQQSGRAVEVDGFHEGCFYSISGSGDTYYAMYAVVFPR